MNFKERKNYKFKNQNRRDYKKKKCKVQKIFKNQMKNMNILIARISKNLNRLIAQI